LSRVLEQDHGSIVGAASDATAPQRQSIEPISMSIVITVKPARKPGQFVALSDQGPGQHG
jgi:hypothetical protein